MTLRLAIFTCCLTATGCAGPIVRPTVTPATPATDALLVLPGFGYTRAGEAALRGLAPAMAADGIDLYVPSYISRGGLDDSRERLERFIREHHLERYERLHVFAFIAGAWSFNRLVDADTVPNLTTIVYDRSPYQERAPRIALERLPVLTWLKYGTVVFDVAKTPYAPMGAEKIRVGLLVETKPTSFIRRFAKAAARQGPYHFECDAFEQRYDDCLYVALSHNEMYTHFADIWPDLRSFIRTSQFTQSANRTPPLREMSVAGRE